jgi:hypothetical protein
MIKNFAVMRLLNKKFLKQNKEAQMEVFLNPKNYINLDESPDDEEESY